MGVQDHGREKRRWSDLTDRQKTALLVAASVQLSLAATAWVDLSAAREQVNGSKAAWAAAIAVNFVGPIAYFTLGVRRP
jgi:bacteriorhodopsin